MKASIIITALVGLAAANPQFGGFGKKGTGKGKSGGGLAGMLSQLGKAGGGIPDVPSWYVLAAAKAPEPR